MGQLCTYYSQQKLRNQYFKWNIMHYYHALLFFFIFSEYSSKTLYLLYKFTLLSKNNFVLYGKRACLGQSFIEYYMLKMLLKTKVGWSNDFGKCGLLHWNFRGAEKFCTKETCLSFFSPTLFKLIWPRVTFCI